MLALHGDSLDDSPSQFDSTGKYAKYGRWKQQETK